MEFTVKKSTILGLGFCAILSFSLLAAGCSSDDTPATKADAGKKDSGRGGSTGSGGSSAKGGSSGSGGSSAKGGSSGSGGSSASGGSNGSGGSGGSGGASSSGGAGDAGGSGGTGGLGGTGGEVQDGGGGASDAIDAPLSGDDGPATETGEGDDGGVPAIVDSGEIDGGGLDSESVDSESLDTTVVLLDAELDTQTMDMSVDIAEPDLGSDLGPDVAADLPIDTTPDPFACPSVAIVSGGSTASFGTTGIYCFATCDEIAGWGASNLEGRQVKVNGELRTVPVGGGTGGQMPLASKVLGTYNLFQVSAGSSTSAAINWWGTTNTTCPEPSGGFFP